MQWMGWLSMLACGLIASSCGSKQADVTSLPLQAADDVLGRCRIDDERFHTEAGGCLQFQTGSVWSVPTLRKATSAEAERYCADLSESGYADWALPGVGALSSLAGIHNARRYIDANISDFFMSATRNTELVFAVDLVSGEAARMPVGDFQGRVICRRLPQDSDHDGVPDLTDQCPETPAGASVSTVGSRKGCSADDLTSDGLRTREENRRQRRAYFQQCLENVDRNRSECYSRCRSLSPYLGEDIEACGIRCTNAYRDSEAACEATYGDKN